MERMDTCVSTVISNFRSHFAIVRQVRFAELVHASLDLEKFFPR